MNVKARARIIGSPFQKFNNYHVKHYFPNFRRISSTLILFLIIILQGLAQKVSERPNFLVIFTDDQTYRAIGYNNDLVKTPILDDLADQGIVFDMAFTSTPICTASRASILTGLYPQTNGTVALDRNSFIKNIVEGKRHKTLAQFLNEAGYATYFSGKSHLGDPKDYGFHFGKESNDDFNDEKAFQDVSDFIKGPNFGSKPYLIWLAPRQPHVPLKPDQKWLDLYAATDITVDQNFLEKPLMESFFNQGLPGENFYRDSDYTDNHKDLPAGPPRSSKIIKEFTKAYYATISHLDFQIGNLIQQLKENGHMENTVIIFLSDNGYFLGNHGLGNKLTMHEESVRIPMFIYWDKLKNKGVRSNSLVSSIDILPSIQDLAGVAIPEYLQGTSLTPILSDPQATIQDYVASESVGVGGKTGTGHRMVRTKNYKYILSDVNDQAFFDLRYDPFEQSNIIDDDTYRKELVTLRNYLKKWKILVADHKPLPSGYE